ncbi:MAG: LacI family transcriptional regulator [Agathobacter sp.]|uniref:LacI family DNA-binding transcriptional regulator n=1 Tax=Agathobacter sp. TaxID=2021311 RepID=UPI002585DA8E|nr:LacI family DNA-binding transcriptional regulator [Agathobacter sp.]MCR5677695.1 LacI family transcriptional regulator [Agathobacter sp.]
MVSLKDIASACGVSVATVSKALNNHTDIGADTKARVQQMAQEMGYHPNAAARTLKTNRTYNIGVLFIDGNYSGLTHDFFNHVLDSFKRTAEAHGYDITFINNGRTQNRKMTYLEHARYRNFDGVVIACVEFSEPEIIELVNSDVPVVTIDHLFNNRIAVMSDNVGGMQQLTRYVIGKGHRKIAYIHGLPSAVTSARLSSFYKTLEENGIAVPDEYVREAAYRSTDETYRETRSLLELDEPPTCILYPDDFACIGGMNAIREKGLRIPEDISVAGYDGIEIGLHMLPQLTTLAQNMDAIGATAAEQLIDLIEKPKTTLIQPNIIFGEVREGGSVADLNP